LGAIKGVGFKAVEAIVKAREQSGPFQSLDDFFERVSSRDVGAGCAETLIRTGAFDCLDARKPNLLRSQLLSVLPRAMQSGQSKQEDRRRGQPGLFDQLEAISTNGHSNGAAVGLSNLPDVAEMSDAELLADEKKALGFYMSSHPLARHAELLQALASHKVSEVAALADKAEVILGGIITNLQARNVQRSRSGHTRMAKFTFEDLSGTTPAMLWPEEFAKLGDLVKNDLIGWVKGTVDRRRDPPEVIVSRIIPLEQGPAELTRGVVVRLHKGLHHSGHLERLLRAVRIRPGNLDLFFEIVGIEQVRRAIYKAGASLRLRYDERLLTELEAAVGAGYVRLLGQRGATARVDAGSGTRPATTSVAAAPVSAAVTSALDDDIDDARECDSDEV
jgi:DNA polymerase-3 subunit alpha